MTTEPERGDRIRILNGALRGEVVQVLSVKSRPKGDAAIEVRTETGRGWVLFDAPAWEPVVMLVSTEQGRLL